MNEITQAQIQAAFANAPAPVQEAFLSEDTAIFSEKLRTEYGLHVDVAGRIGSSLGRLLLGLTSPAEFLADLVSRGVQQDVANKILNDLNTQIFVPLREKMRAQGSGENAQAKPTAPAAAPAAQSVALRPPAQSAPAMPKPPAPQAIAKPMPEPPANLPGVVMPKAAPAPQPNPVAKPVFATSFAPNAAPMNAPIAPKPVVVPQVVRSTGLASALKSAGVPLLEDHEEPHIEIGNSRQATDNSQLKIAPAPAPAPRVMPTTMPPVQPMPIAPVAPKPSAPMPSAPVQSTVAPQRPPAPQQPPVKAYAVDPYREQPEEHEK